MTKKQMTATAWLFEQIIDALLDYIEGKISASAFGIEVTEFKYKAKEMEKQQIIDAFDCDGYGRPGEVSISCGEQYYNEFFNN